MTRRLDGWSFVSRMAPRALGHPIRSHCTMRSSKDCRLSQPRWSVFGSLAEQIPRLAAALALGPIDNALHDAWALCAGRHAFDLYSSVSIREKLRLGLRSTRTHLPIQHVVGIHDPLVTDAEPGGLRSLKAWVASDGIAHVKVKVGGHDPDEDANRVAEVYQVLASTAARVGSISIDPNEGYHDTDGVLAMLTSLRRQAPAAYLRLAYIEQPISRESIPDPRGMRAVGKHIPVVADEAVAGVEELIGLSDQGWSGLVIKAAKGQTLALRSYSLARAGALFVTIQDLTAVDLALEHSARLASRLRLSSPAFEYNSRQYAPHANADLALRRPALVQVEEGRIVVGPPAGSGIY